jgi:hypothetical protein
MLPTEASTVGVILPISPELGCFDGIDRACASSLAGTEVYKCEGNQYSNHRFSEAIGKINHTFAQISVNLGGTRTYLIIDGKASTDAETYFQLRVTCENFIAVSYLENYGVQPIGGQYFVKSSLGKRSDTSLISLEKRSSSSGSYGKVLIEGSQMVVLQMINDEVLFASMWNENGPHSVSFAIEIGDQVITAEQMNPEFFKQIPLETKYKPMVAAKNGGAGECFQSIATTCSSTFATERYICAGSSRSDTAFFGALKQLDAALDNVFIKLNDISIPLISDGRISSGIMSTVEHISTCSDFMQTSWNETFVLFRGIDLGSSAESLVASTRHTSRMVLDTTPNRVTATLIQMKDKKTEFVCMFTSEAGQLEFADLREEGKDIKESQYNCAFFLEQQAEQSLKHSSPSISTSIIQDTIERALEEKGIVIIEVPADCFSGIETSCSGEVATDKFVCSENAVSDLLVEDAYSSQGFSDVKFTSMGDVSVFEGISSGNAKTSISHNAICANNTEMGWTEVYQITTTKDTTRAGSSYGVAVIEQTSFFAAISFMQMQVNSFGVSSVQ